MKPNRAGRCQACTKETDLSCQSYRDAIAYKDWKNFFENREGITLAQMKATSAVIVPPEECIDKAVMLSERVGLAHVVFEVKLGALPHPQVGRSPRLFAARTMPRLV